MSTSGTFNFGSTQSEQIIVDAYERMGILPNQLTDENIISAQRSLNFLFASWANRGPNLSTRKQEMLALYPNQNAYELPTATGDILWATIRTSTRNLGGTPASSAGGVAANAFDSNSQTACTQNAPNGNISYSWSPTQFAIAMVGVQSNATLTYTLTFEYSNDGVTWSEAFTPSAQTYTQGINVWFVIPGPTLGTQFRVRETDGATLNIQELYFNTTIQDTIITRISESEYVSYSQKNQTGRPTSYFVDRQNSPIVYLWPTPTVQYNNMFYVRTEYYQDIGTMQNSCDIPLRFLEPLTAGLAHSLSIKFGTDLNKTQMLKMLYEEQYRFAGMEDVERVPLRIYSDPQQGWSQR